MAAALSLTALRMLNTTRIKTAEIMKIFRPWSLPSGTQSTLEDGRRDDEDCSLMTGAILGRDDGLGEHND